MGHPRLLIVTVVLIAAVLVATPGFARVLDMNNAATPAAGQNSAATPVDIQTETPPGGGRWPVGPEGGTAEPTVSSEAETPEASPSPGTSASPEATPQISAEECEAIIDAHRAAQE